MLHINYDILLPLSQGVKTSYRNLIKSNDSRRAFHGILRVKRTMFTLQRVDTYGMHLDIAREIKIRVIGTL